MPEGQPDGDNIIFFSRPEAGRAGSLEFEEALLRSIMSEENADFLFDKAQSLGVEVKELLDVAIESYAGLYDLFEEGRRLFYLGTDKKMHPIDEDPDQPKAV